MSTDIPVGSVLKVIIPTIADRAARRIMKYRTARALTIDPEGRVHVEAPGDVCESDLVGVYRYADAGLLKLTREIQEDLRHEVGVRNLRPSLRPRGRGAA